MSLNKKQKDKKQKFCEEAAKGINPYKAALNAGYSMNYAKSLSYKLMEQNRNEIEKLKPIVEKQIKQEFKYDINAYFKDLLEIKNLAMQPNAKGDYTNLSTAVKCTEDMARAAGIDGTRLEKEFNINVMGNIEIGGKKLVLKIGEDVNDINETS